MPSGGHVQIFRLESVSRKPDITSYLGIISISELMVEWIQCVQLIKGSSITGIYQICSGHTKTTDSSLRAVFSRSMFRYPDLPSGSIIVISLRAVQ